MRSKTPRARVFTFSFWSTTGTGTTIAKSPRGLRDGGTGAGRAPEGEREDPRARRLRPHRSAHGAAPRRVLGAGPLSEADAHDDDGRRGSCERRRDAWRHGAARGRPPTASEDRG